MKTLFKCTLILIFINSSIQCLHSQTLKSFNFLELEGSDSAIVTVFADGNIKGLITNSEQKTTTTNGALGISVVKNKIIWNAYINIASTIDTLKSDYGKVILNPASGKGFTSGLLEFYIKDIVKKYNIGLHCYASGSSSNWSFKDTSKSATVFGLGALVTKDIINGKIFGDNEAAFCFEFGPSYRGVFGNISNNMDFYNRLMGTKGNHYLGFEGGLVIRFNNVTAGIQGYWLNDIVGKKKIDGVTSFQITGGISISGSILKGKTKI